MLDKAGLDEEKKMVTIMYVNLTLPFILHVTSSKFPDFFPEISQKHKIFKILFDYEANFIYILINQILKT